MLAFEIRAGRRELRQGEFVAVMPCALTNTQYTIMSRFGSVRGLGVLARAAAMRKAFSGCSTTLSEGPPAGLKPAALRLFAHLPLLRQDPIHLPTLASRLALVISLQQPIRNCAPPTFSMPPSVLHMLASACESARSGYGAHVRCWILTGVSARQRTAAALNRRLGLESDLLAESSIFVAESDGCQSQFAFHSQP